MNSSIHIMHLEPGKGDLIFYFDEHATAQLEAGEDMENIVATAFSVKAHGNALITDIIIDFVDGKPVAVKTVEET